MDGWLHPNSSIQRSYTKQKEVGQKLVKATILDDIHEYIGKVDPSDELLSEYLRQQKVWTERQHRVRIMAEQEQELSTKSTEIGDHFPLVFKCGI